MKLLLVLTIMLISLTQYLGVFYTGSTKSDDFLFTIETSITKNISIVQFNELPQVDDLNNLLHILNIANPKAIGLDIPVEINTTEYPNLIKRDSTKLHLPYEDADGKTRNIPCADSYALTLARVVTPGINCLADTMTVNYSLTATNIEIFDAGEVISGKTNPTSAIVLISLSPLLAGKYYSIPISSVPVSKVIIDANVINSLVTGTQLLPLPLELSLILSIIILAVFGMILVRVKFLNGLVALAIFLILQFIFVWFAYLNNILIDFFYIPIGLLVIYVTQLAYDYFTQYKSKVFIEWAFGKYLSKKVLEQLLKNPEKVQLGGERKVISMLFVDIKSFTVLAERESTDSLVVILNRFLSYVSDIVIHEDGTIDKYVGDEVVAFWNAPLSQPDHSVLAARAALEINKGIYKEINHVVGIGLNTGMAFVGNVGSQYLYDYTAIGDNVNITSRLERLTRIYQVPIIASEAFMRSVGEHGEGDSFKFRLLDKVALKGKSNLINIYELVGKIEDLDYNQNSVISNYESAVYLYQNDRFKEAEDILTKIVNDPPSKYLLQKINEIKKRKNELEGSI